MEKTLSTFHASNVLLQQQYREKGFKMYSELISHLLVAEQNNDLLMKNHENRPTRSTPFPEVNEVYAHHARRKRGRGRGRGRERNYDQERNPFPSVNHSPKKNHYQKGKGKDEKRETVKTNCFRCGGRGHYATPKHLVELYQTSLRKKDKNPEANIITDHVDITHLDAADFFTHPEEKIDHLIGDGSMDMEE
ncbi:hypothetical protein R3W88_032019 [Solanum pinnatisectum]|uniref:CCHC-type domain-containing protein n=1 Tax=Solanum pinnatisectum TaxID=50273 RepID=A0AAV9LMZ6_9SOLN|nr:hypothetical protein R3W88_032019 [Solanum pinnatisectum]